MQAVNDSTEEDDIELIQSLLPDNLLRVKALLPEKGSESRDGENEEKDGKTNAPDRAMMISAKACQCARHLLYVSHAFNQFSEFAWQFSLTIFLAAVVNYQSIVLVSTYGFATQLAVVMACPKLGTWLDHVDTNRLRAAQIFIGLETVAVWMTTACCFMLLSSRADASDSHQAAGAKFEDASSTGSTFANVTFDTNQLALLVLIHFFGSVVTVLDQAFTIAMERDWVVNMCRASAEAVAQSGDEAVHANDNGCSHDVAFSAHLSTMNVTMKQIDLSCKVVGPAVAGLLLPLITSVSSSQRTTTNCLEWGCLFIGGLNTLALVAEYIRTSRIYTLVPALSDKVVEHEHRKHGNDETDSSGERTFWLDRFTSPELRLYTQQPTALHGFSLAFLYCNGLTFGNGIMTAYLLYRQLQLPAIGVIRGVASAIGLLGTCAYSFMAKRLGLVTTGLCSVVCEAICLGLAYCAVQIDSDVSLSLLIAGVCASRIGLWIVDIAVTQMQQEQVADGARVKVGAVQSAMNAFFTLASFAIGFLCPDPARFHVYVASAFLCVSLAASTFWCGMRTS